MHPPSLTPEPGRLRPGWSRARLDEALRTQLEIGQRLTADWYEPEKWGDHPDTWHQKNLAILRHALTTDELLKVYNEPLPPTPPGHSDRRHAFDVRLPRLKMVLDLVPLYEEEPVDAVPPPQRKSSTQVFLVHGRDHGTRDTVARVLQQLTSDEPLILEEAYGVGATIIEKFEQHADTAAAAVVILSPDDVGGLVGEAPQLRARQNVVYELGQFHSRLGRGHVLVLLVGEVELPSDLAGVIDIPVDDAGAWRAKVGLHLRAADIAADLNNLHPWG